MITKEEAHRLARIAPNQRLAILPTGLEIDLAETILSLYDRIDEMAIELGERTEEILELEALMADANSHAIRLAQILQHRIDVGPSGH